MSSKHSKPKTIHVDKVIIKANEVVIIDENRNRRLNPWLGGSSRYNEDESFEDEVVAEEEKLEEEEDEVELESKDERKRPPFSWI